MWNIILQIIFLTSITGFGIWFIIQKYFKELWMDMKTNHIVANIFGGIICFGIGSFGIAGLIFLWVQGLMNIFK